MYLIEILHQTTTARTSTGKFQRCILSKFYIKPQPRVPRLIVSTVVSYRNSTSNHNISFGCFFVNTLYLIEILHQTTTLSSSLAIFGSCILSKFYIKPQQARHAVKHYRSCILSKFYIKPQRYRVEFLDHVVVSYRNSTSNHNGRHSHGSQRIVVSYRNSTSNHNVRSIAFAISKLYLIEILHQTTTSVLILIDKVLLTGCLPL